MSVFPSRAQGLIRRGVTVPGDVNDIHDFLIGQGEEKAKKRRAY